MKAISTVIASILMLMIVIALGGTAYLYISGVFTSKTSSTFEISGIDRTNVMVRNIGTGALTKISASSAGTDLNARILPSDTNIVAYYGLDEGFGNVIQDESPTVRTYYQNNGIAYNSPAWVDGQYGKSLQFDGVNDYIEVGDSASLMPSSITVSLWINLLSDPNCDGNNNWRFILSKDAWGNGYWLVLEDGRDLTWSIGTSGSDKRLFAGAASQLPVGKWKHVAATYDEASGTLKVFVDGNPINSLTYSAGPITYPGTPGKLRIGGMNLVACPSGSGTPNAIIDDVTIFKRALNDDEIKDIFKNGIRKISAGSIGKIAFSNLLPFASEGTKTFSLGTSSMRQTGFLTVKKVAYFSADKCVNCCGHTFSYDFATDSEDTAACQPDSNPSTPNYRADWVSGGCCGAPCDTSYPATPTSAGYSGTKHALEYLLSPNIDILVAYTGWCFGGSDMNIWVNDIPLPSVDLTPSFVASPTPFAIDVSRYSSAQKQN